MNELMLRALRLLLCLQPAASGSAHQEIEGMIEQIDVALGAWHPDILITPREPYIDPMTGAVLPEGS